MIPGFATLNELVLSQILNEMLFELNRLLFVEVTLLDDQSNWNAPFRLPAEVRVKLGVVVIVLLYCEISLIAGVVPADSPNADTLSKL